MVLIIIIVNRIGFYFSEIQQYPKHQEEMWQRPPSMQKTPAQCFNAACMAD